jgi:hypothetical protein
VVNVTSATAQTATVDLSRGEAIALLNLLREAHRLARFRLPRKTSIQGRA